jgi:hypothetical protein
VPAGTPPEPFLREVEAIARGLGGRPHWASGTGAPRRTSRPPTRAGSASRPSGRGWTPKAASPTRTCGARWASSRGAAGGGAAGRAVRLGVASARMARRIGAPVAAGVVATALAAAVRSPRGRGPRPGRGRRGGPRGLLGVVWCGVVAWRRRPGNPTGRWLLGGVGLTR